MRGLRRRLERHGAERGLTLAEMLVSSAVLLVVLAAAGSLLYSGTVSQRDVRSVNDATTAAQTVVASVENGVRNAVALRYTRSGTDNADELLVVRTLVGAKDAPTSQCRAWFYSAADDILYSRSVPVSSTPTAMTAPTATQLAQWTTVAGPVLPPAGAGVFAPSADQVRVDVNLSVPARSFAPATISTSVVRRLQEQTGGTPCF